MNKNYTTTQAAPAAPEQVQTELSDRDTLAFAIARAAERRGIIEANMPLTGPQLIMLCDALAAPSAAAPAAPSELPAILFDGKTVYDEITRHLGKSHCFAPEAVATTLDAVVRLMRKEGAYPAAEQVAIPEGYVLMPKRLTAENGAKYARSGEFKESINITCHECGGSGDGDEDDTTCAECNGDGTLEQGVPVTWDTIKRIYAAAVELLAAAPAAPIAAAQVREEVRDQALEDAANAVASTNTLGMTAASAITKLCAAIRAMKTAASTEQKGSEHE